MSKLQPAEYCPRHPEFITRITPNHEFEVCPHCYAILERRVEEMSIGERIAELSTQLGYYSEGEGDIIAINKIADLQAQHGFEVIGFGEDGLTIFDPETRDFEKLEDVDASLFNDYLNHL